MIQASDIDKLLARSRSPNREYLQNLIRNKRLAGLSEKGIANHISHIHCFLTDIGYPDAATLTKADIEDWYLAKKGSRTPQGKPVSPATIKGYIISIGVLCKSIFGEEKGKEMISGIRIKAPLTNVREEELLTDDELKQMMKAATSERDRALLAIMYSSGARLGEISGLNLGDVQLHKLGASLHVSGKTGERDIDMFVGVPELRSWLNVHPLKGIKEAPLFVTRYPRGGRYKRLSDKAIESLFLRLASAAGIPEGKRTNPHAYRHKRATDVAEYLTTSDMREMFGWADGSGMPNIYVHSSRKKVRAKLAERAGIKVPETAAPTTMVKQCPVCGCINGANDDICANCHAILADELDKYHKAVMEYVSKNMQGLL